jgi:pimeloyl-ACP methyl ester carboxylesterase
VSQFVLVHGGGNGPWKWELLEPELVARGHSTLAVDMPVDRTDVGMDGYIDAVCEQMAAGLDSDRDVVLVGHSLAGHVIPYVANRHPVQALVFLCAALPGDYDPNDGADEGRPPPGLRADDPHGFTLDDQGRAVITDAAALNRNYHDCPPEVAARMIARRRPQSQSFRTNIPELDKWPDVRPFYIACVDDRTSARGKAARAADVLGVEPLQLPGGHSPMVSRPAALAELLHIIAQASGHYRH